MATPAELFDDIAATLCGYCNAPEVVIRVNMEFSQDPFEIVVVRHLRDPNNLFDNSGDANMALEEPQLATIRSKVEAYFDASRQWEQRLVRTTLSIYQDGTWSVGSTCEDK